jgi:hypothetical protein
MSKAGGTGPLTGGGTLSQVANSGIGAPTVGSSPYPNQQIAPMTGMQTQAMQNVQNLTAPQQAYLQSMLNQTNQLTGGVGTGLNTTNQLQGMTPGSMQTNQQLQGAAGSAMPMQNWLASGAAMNPQTNQYLQQYFNAAAQPMEQQFQQTIAPNLLQNAAQTGTLGSAGAAQGMQNAQTALSQGLGNLAAGIYEPAYSQGLTATQNAVNQGLNTGLSASQQGLNTGLSAAGQGLNAGMNAMNMAPGLSSAMYNPAQQQYNFGQYGQTQAQNTLNQAYQNLQNQANWPFTALNMLGQGINTAAGGGSTGTSVATSPSQAMGK